MSSRSLEANLLRNAEAIISTHVARRPANLMQEARFQLLEGVASRLGGFDLARYHSRFNIEPIEPTKVNQLAARRMIEAIALTGIPAPLVVSALAREVLANSNKRSSGAYHTDFRLATHLASRLVPELQPRANVIDPACGAGMLLTALMLQTCVGDRKLAAEWLAEGVWAADLSENALRGCLISLSCLTDNLDALITMRTRWLLGDSLMCASSTWNRLVPGGFDAVIANPPWEKVKLTRHEFLQANGHSRHYGSDYDQADFADYARQTNAAKSYARAVGDLHSNAGTGETDLFVAFSDLARKLLRPGGEAALLVPAGLIRSKTTEPLRRELEAGASRLSVDVFENRARFFEIDTRFKFLCVHWRARAPLEKALPIELGHSSGTETGVELGARVHLGRSTLARLRPDLSIPEVRSEAEWQLFCRMTRAGIDWSKPESAWHPEFMREVDMTRDRPHFTRRAEKSALPLIEGRMVHQHRFGAKGYVSGTGRSAIWNATLLGSSELHPQYYIPNKHLSAGARRRSELPRAGFCDITGQTNERSCLAAMIPPGVVCGNKVPTILFPNDQSEERLWLWVAIANSLPFDWMLRRVITTTINYFHFLSLRLPPIEPESLPGRQLVEIGRTLEMLDRDGASPAAQRDMAELRCRADRLIAVAYGLTEDDLAIMIADFPLIDRTQPALEGERRSTVTQDLLLGRAHGSQLAAHAHHRFELAKALGAIAYVPAQFAASMSFDVEHTAHG